MKVRELISLNAVITDVREHLDGQMSLFDMEE